MCLNIINDPFIAGYFDLVTELLADAIASCKFSRDNRKYDMVRVPSPLMCAISFIIFIIINSSFTLAETGNRMPRYVGSDACKNCHEHEYRNFTTYAKKSISYKSLERVKKGLTADELKGCYYCHTTGYGKPGGFVSPEKTPNLKNAGCEVCHGPGEFHIRTRSPNDIKHHLTIKDCEVCHTPERVKAFRYKPLIHGGAH